MPEELTSYDQVPYRSYPFRQSHPGRLATIARLFGLTTAPLEECRVLELGCAGGGNLIPLAAQYPKSHFQGIDLSTSQIKSGSDLVEQAGLSNISLQARDILKFETDPSSFDYVICHGVFSWVPNTVQDRILEIARSSLRPNGVAYISYNTNPGWRMRGMIRDIMRYRARSFDSPQVQLSQARSLLEFLYASVKGDDTAYSMLLKTEVASMNNAEDYYLLHEQLEEINEPLYFHQFVDRARSAGLQYLGESDFGTMSLDNFPEDVRNMLNSVSHDSVEIEQYMDFLRNRAFRQTLLCHQEVQLDRKPLYSRLQGLYVASSGRPESDVELNQDVKVTFRRGASVLTTNNPYVKAAMLHLGSIWPESISFVDLASLSRSMVEGRPGAVGSNVMSPGTQHLADTLLRCFASGQVDLHVGGVTFVTDVSETPLATVLSRMQARESTSVTNRLHETVQLDDLHRYVLCGLDGTRDSARIIEFVADFVVRGELVLHHGGQRITEQARVHAIIGQSLPEILKSFAQRALLIG